MNGKHYLKGLSTAFALATVSLGAIAQAAAPTAEQALKLKPVQADVTYDTPDAASAAKASLRSEKTDLGTAWVLRDDEGQVIRRFVDTNDDNVVDLWCYFSQGVESYRDIDSNFNGRADQCRWLNSGGTRWGIDQNEDGKIDAWKTISAEEVSYEVVQALVERDATRFTRLLLSADELTSLGLAPARQQEITTRLAEAKSEFEKVLARQTMITPKTQWVHFGATRPGIVPQGTDGSTKDLLVYENVSAVIQNGDKNAQVQIGTLVSTGGTWRLIGAPGLGESQEPAGYFIRTAHPGSTATAGGDTGETVQKLLSELEIADRATAAATSPAAQVKALEKRMELLEKLAAAAHERDRPQWLSQLADTISAAAQSGSYPQGVEKLRALADKLAAEGGDLPSYAEFRCITTEYTVSLQAPKPAYEKIHTQWLEKLKGFVEKYPKSPDAAEAMLQLAMAEEVSGQEDDAIKWYRKIATDFPNLSQGKKSLGAMRRLTSVGKPIALSGTTSTGSKLDIAQLKGRVVLVHYWATNSELSLEDVKLIKDLYAKYGRDGFTPVGISLDYDAAAFKAYVQQNRISWPQFHDAGGTDGDMANELGILTLPTMLLLDKSGKVVNRGVLAGELESEIQKYMKAK